MDRFNCPGLRLVEGGFECVRRPGEWPEDGDWEAFCRACLEDRDREIDAAVEAALEREWAP